MPDGMDDGRGDALLDVLVSLALALAMTEEPPISALLDLLVTGAAGLFPGSSIGVSAVGSAVPVPCTAASDEWGLRCERLHSTSGDGPGWVALAASDTSPLAQVLVPDLCVDDRFPWFRRHAASTGIGGVFSFPLQHGQTRLGVLNLYQVGVGDLLPGEVAAARTLARVTAAYLVAVQRRIDLQSGSDAARQQALHDPLTGLPNRTLMLERIGHAVQRTRRTGGVFAVLYLDLDGFKTVNDTFGHAVGDELLVAVTTRLSSLLRPPDTLARLHGDEFVLLCEDLTEPQQAVQICHRLQEALNEPVTVKGAPIRLRASVGVVVTDTAVDEPATVLRDADRAMYEAKRRGGAQFYLHHPVELL